MELVTWKTNHIETLSNGALVKMRVGVPTSRFWSIWRESKDTLTAQNYKLFSVEEDRKKVWYVKKAVEVVQQETVDKNIKEVFCNKLLPHQHEHFNSLYKAFQYGSGVVDNSDTGTGKTPVACAIGKLLKLPLAIVCPLPVIPTWEKWAKYVGTEILFIANYESFKGKGNKYGYMDIRYYPSAILRYIWRDSTTISMNQDVYTRSWSDAIHYIEKQLKLPIKTRIQQWEENNKIKFPKNKCREVLNFVWLLPKRCLVIFDEVHKCKGPYTQNAKMLAACKNNNTLMLSATLAQSPKDMRSIGYLLGLHQLYDFTSWMSKNSCIQNKWNGWDCLDPILAMQNLSRQIYPLRGSRMRIKDIPDFPDNQIVIDCYRDEIRTKYNKEYANLLGRINDLEREGAEQINVLTEILRFRQSAELLKVPLYISMVKNALENGLAVPLFVNYTETRLAIQKTMKHEWGIYGGQHPAEREKAIYNFQHDVIRFLIVMNQAGGIGISLHDEFGLAPRMSIISPTYDARIFKQILGRSHRAGAQSKTLQRVVYLEGTIEEEICASVNSKINNINALNDGDLMERDVLKILMERNNKND